MRAGLAAGLPDLASMGPPHVRGGKDIKEGERTVDDFALQWGRRMFAAESYSRTRGETEAGPLQWGRRMFAAERRTLEIDIFAPYRLQWGRRMFAAESWIYSDESHGSTIPLQWGRRMFAAERNDTTQGVYQFTGFNGAAACSRRKGVGGTGIATGAT